MTDDTGGHTPDQPPDEVEQWRKAVQDKMRGTNPPPDNRAAGNSGNQGDGASNQPEPTATGNGTSTIGGLEQPDIKDDERIIEVDGRLELSDGNIAKYLAVHEFRGELCWTKNDGWRTWTGQVWQRVSDERVAEDIRSWVFTFRMAEQVNSPGWNATRASRVANIQRTAARIRSIRTFLTGMLEVNPKEFDQHPDLLNVGNGIVDLQTKELLDYDSSFMFTKMTPVCYIPGAQHADWDTALSALPDDATRKMMQRRAGQSATGHPPPDDSMLFLRGHGSNGKTTILAPWQLALGDFAVTIDERVLQGSMGDHPTEFTVLNGVRFAVMDELPEGGINVARMKKSQSGGNTMTARKMRQDADSFELMHSLVISTNHRHDVNASDHGTWRRMIEVPFPYRYRKEYEELIGDNDVYGDPGLRNRMRYGQEQLEAVLAWIIDGAAEWYANDQEFGPLPLAVATATERWRLQSDVILAYYRLRLIADKDWHIATADLADNFSDWLMAGGDKSWSARTSSIRFAAHEVFENNDIRTERIRADQKTGTRRSDRPDSMGVQLLSTSKGRYNAFVGVRFRTEADPDPEIEDFH